MEVNGCSRTRVRLGQTRRAWSTREEEVLVASLKGLLSKGWKTDNGFRSGYLSRLEESMSIAFPGTDLKGYPHINSKLTTWKRTYFILQAALCRSGVGFNESTYMIDCTDEVWQQVVQADKTAENMRFKQFPLYPAWVEFYGKDRANGRRAEDVLDAIGNLIRDDNLFPDAPHAGDYRVSLDHIMEAHDAALDEESPGSKPSRKKKKVDTLDRMCDMVGKLVSNTDKIEDIANYLGYEFKLGEKRGKIDELVFELPDLTVEETFELGDVFAKDSDRLEYFAGLAMEKRLQYARRLLDRLVRN